MKKRLTSIVVSTLIALSFEGYLLADDAPPLPRESYFNALLGVAVSATSAGSNAFTFGGRLGTTLFATSQGLFSAGISVGNSSTTSQQGTTTISGNTTLLTLELITRRAWQTGLYFGGRFGLGLASASITASGLAYNASATPFAVGPVAGYEFSITPSVSINLDVSWLVAAGSTLNFVGLGSLQTNPSSSFLFQGGAVYRW